MRKRCNYKKDVGKRISKAVNNDFVKNFFTLGEHIRLYIMA